MLVDGNALIRALQLTGTFHQAACRADQRGPHRRRSRPRHDAGDRANRPHRPVGHGEGAKAEIREEVTNRARRPTAAAGRDFHRRQTQGPKHD
jgi:hypothetical protein